MYETLDLFVASSAQPKAAPGRAPQNTHPSCQIRNWKDSRRRVGQNNLCWAVIDSGFLWSQYHPILSNIIQHPSNIIQHHPTSSTFIIYHPISSNLIQCPFLLYGWPFRRFWGDEFKASLKERPLALRPWLVVVVDNYLKDSTNLFCCFEIDWPPKKKPWR